ncbi:MAG: ATP-binding cassette domain-containing protein [Prevotella sp.]|nr:ATP-binding cassette domain-containing protein [Prevotella sp.]
MEQHIIEVDSVSKTYGGRTVLSGVYLKVQTGDICALFGRNGTGKSTLMKIIYGTLRADHKYQKIDEHFLTEPYKHASYISYLPDVPFIPKNLKVRHVFNLYNIPKECLDDIALHFYNSRISELSSGERRYVEICLILLKKAHFVLLDEPYKFLSPLMVEKIERLILSQSKEKGIIIADHRYRDVLNIANRILLIKDSSLFEVANEKELAEKGYIL